MSVLNKPFESKYGFQSNGFSVDENGNISATSIVLETDTNTDAPPDYTITTVDNNSYVGINPSVVLMRSTTYIFELDLSATLRFAILDNNSLYSNGLRHSDGTFGINAQNKTTGRLFFTVPVTAPDTLYYGDSIRTLVGGTFQVVDPPGSFTTLDVSSNATFEDNVEIQGDLTIQGNVTFDEIVGVTATINPSSEILLKVNNGVIGTVNSSGLELTNIAVESGTITDVPTENTHITNKNYVDTRTTALAIALGS